MEEKIVYDGFVKVKENWRDSEIMLKNFITNLTL